MRRFCTLSASVFITLMPLIASTASASSAGLSDLNGDGHADALLVDPSGTGDVLATDGPSGVVLWRAERGAAAVAEAIVGPDLTGDGIGEVILSRPLDARWQPSGGSVEFLDGSNGNQLFTWSGASGSHLGEGLARLDDMTGDGVDEVAVSMVMYDEQGWAWGRVLIVDIMSERVVAAIKGATAGDGFGATMAQIDDFDGDGFRDLAIAAPRFDHGEGEPVGRVYAFAGGIRLGFRQIVEARTGALVTIDNQDATASRFAGALLRGRPHSGVPTLLTLSLTATFESDGSVAASRWSLAEGERLEDAALAMNGAAATVAGDVDADHEVTALDLAAAASVAGHSTNSVPGYAAADADLDGVIEVADLVTVMAAVGERTELASWGFNDRSDKTVLSLLSVGATEPASPRQVDAAAAASLGASACQRPLCVAPPTLPDDFGDGDDDGVVEPDDGPGIDWDDFLPDVLEPRHSETQLPGGHDPGLLPKYPPGDTGPQIVSLWHMEHPDTGRLSGLLNVNTGHFDDDLIPAYADGRDATDNPDDLGWQERIAFVAISPLMPLLDADGMSTPRVRVDYPGAPTPATSGPPDYQPEGLLRVWTSINPRDGAHPADDAALGGQFVTPGRLYSFEDLGVTTGIVDDLWRSRYFVILYVEALAHTDGVPAEVTIDFGDGDVVSFDVYPVGLEVVSEDGPVSRALPMSEWTPQLEADVVSWGLNDGGEVELRVIGSYRDRLTDLMPDAAGAAGVEFVVNGEVVTTVPAATNPRGDMWGLIDTSTAFDVTVRVPLDDWGFGNALTVRTKANPVGRRSEHRFTAGVSLVPEGWPGFGEQQYVVTAQDPDDPFEVETFGLSVEPVQRLTARGVAGGGDHLRALRLRGVPEGLTSGINVEFLDQYEGTFVLDAEGYVAHGDDGRRLLLGPSSDMYAASDAVREATFPMEFRPEGWGVSRSWAQVYFTDDTWHGINTFVGWDHYEYGNAASGGGVAAITAGRNAPTTREEVMAAYQVLYGDFGMYLLEEVYGALWLEAGDAHPDPSPPSGLPRNVVVLDEFAWDAAWLLRCSDLDYVADGEHYIRIELDSNCKPLTLATELYNQLVKSLSRQPVKQRIDYDDFGVDDEQAFRMSVEQATKSAAKVTGDLTNAYYSGLTILSEPADLVLVIGEVTEGNYEAAIGVLPLVSARATTLVKFANDAKPNIRVPKDPDARLQAARVALGNLPPGTPFSQRVHIITNVYQVSPSTLSSLIRERTSWVSGSGKRKKVALDLGEIGGRMSRGDLKRRWQAAGEPTPKSIPGLKAHLHHELPWALADRFAALLIDVSDPRFGRIVYTRKDRGYASIPDHLNWSKRHLDEWDVELKRIEDGLEAGEFDIQSAQQEIFDILERHDLEEYMSKGGMFPTLDPNAD